MIQVSLSNKIAKSLATRDLIDAGDAAGKIQFMEGARTGIDAPLTSNIIAELLLTKPCGTVDEFGLHLTQAIEGQVILTGTINWARVVDSDSNPVFSGEVLASTDPNASSADFVIDNNVAFSGALINLISASIAEGG